MKHREPDTRKLRKEMEKVQSEKRFEHTLGVAYTATALAMKNNISLKDAEIAGLLHDCAKCIDDKEKIKICEKNHINITDIERENPYLLHAKVGHFIAKSTYQIENEDILNAILNHTTGRPEMSLLEKIIFISDYIEPTRKDAPNLSHLRQLAFENIDLTLLKILEDTLTYLHNQNKTLDPMTQITYDYYKKELNHY